MDSYPALIERIDLCKVRIEIISKFTENYRYKEWN